jgi:hypothetical protein
LAATVPEAALGENENPTLTVELGADTVPPLATGERYGYCKAVTVGVPARTVPVATVADREYCGIAATEEMVVWDTVPSAEST